MFLQLCGKGGILQMNKQEYNNVIETTLAQQTGEKDSLETTREVLSNMGAVLPQGDLKQVSEGLATDDYMGWRKCTAKEAQEYANEGIAVVAVSEDKIAIVVADDEDAQIASLSEAVLNVKGSTPVSVEENTVFYANSVRSSQTNQYTMYNDYLMYRLVVTFYFLECDARLIRILYDKVNSAYSGRTAKHKAWVISRLLGGLVYGHQQSGMGSQMKWDDVAGSVFSTTESEYFVGTLGYTNSEYEQLKEAVKAQHNDASTPDFAHMQISLAARLAYHLDYDGMLSNIGTGESDEDISYLAGWLGDATITTDDQVYFKDDDYCADLDAENIYRRIVTGENYLVATREYYSSLTATNTRAKVFLSYISLSVVMLKVMQRLDVSGDDLMEEIHSSFPDTYNFIMSLNNRLEHMAQF